MKIDCNISWKSSDAINGNMIFFKKLKEIILTSKIENKTENLLLSDGCKAIFNNAKYITNLEILCLNSNR